MSQHSSWLSLTKLVPTRIRSSLLSCSRFSLSRECPWCCIRTHNLFISAKLRWMKSIESLTVPVSVSLQRIQQYSQYTFSGTICHRKKSSWPLQISCLFKPMNVNSIWWHTLQLLRQRRGEHSSYIATGSFSGRDLSRDVEHHDTFQRDPLRCLFVTIR